MPKKIKIEGTFNNVSHTVHVGLMLFYFIDENGTHIVYCPHLDLSGYGTTEVEANTSFDYSLGEFFDYTLKKNTLKQVLSELGWRVGGLKRKSAHIRPPELSELIRKNSYVSEILNTTEFSTKRKDVALPQM